MSLRDRWRARTDDARRTKGDPPPTYAQLQTALSTVTATTLQQGEIIRNLSHQRDALNAENRDLRTALAEKSDYIGQLALELAEVKAEGICGDESPNHAVNCSGTMRALCHDYDPEATT